MSYKKITDFPTFVENPFWDKVIAGKHIKLWNTSDSHLKMQTEHDSEMNILSHKPITETFKKERFYDNQEFLKLYTETIKSLKKLKATSALVFYEMLDGLKKDSDVIRFDINTFMVGNGYRSKSNVYNAISELIENEFIARIAGSNEHYFINVYKVYYGKREEHDKLGDLLKMIKHESYINKDKNRKK
jgi:hypothetical protein